MKDGLLPVMGLLLVWNGAYVAAVHALRRRPLGRVLAVLGASAAGCCVGLNAIWIRYDRRGWSASPSGYGGTLASLIADLILIVGPLALLGAGLGAWAGIRLSAEPSSRVPLAVAAAAIGIAAIAAIASI